MFLEPDIDILWLVKDHLWWYSSAGPCEVAIAFELSVTRSLVMKFPGIASLSERCQLIVL